MKYLFFILSIFFSFPAFGQTDSPTPDKPRVHRYVNTARQVNEINVEYPYDIVLKNEKGDSLLSEHIFEKNEKPTILLFWLTTCSPCRAEMKAISEKYEDWKKEADFNFYAISIDFPRNYPAFQNKVKNMNWPFPAYYDLNREFRLIMPGQLNGLPQVFILNKNGEIVFHKRKYTPGDEDELFKKIKDIK